MLLRNTPLIARSLNSSLVPTLRASRLPSCSKNLILRRFQSTNPPPPATPAAKKPQVTFFSKWRRRLKWTMYAGIVVGSVAFTISYRTNPPPQYTPDPSKKTLVVLGSGWGATSFISKLDTSEYNVVVVSPRNFFLYTPLLPSVTTGSVESRSIMTPIRYFTRFKPFAVNVVEAECTDIDIKTKTVEISDNSEITGEVSKTRIPYDYLVVSVGAENQTFGIKV